MYQKNSIIYSLKDIYTTRESNICSRADFSFVPGIFAPGTNTLICTGWIHYLVQMSPHRGASGPPPNSVQMAHICTGWRHHPV
jgi:hypothetical protein